MDRKAQSSFEMLLLLAVVLFIALLVGLYLFGLAKNPPKLPS